MPSSMILFRDNKQSQNHTNKEKFEKSFFEISHENENNRNTINLKTELVKTQKFESMRFHQPGQSNQSIESEKSRNYETMQNAGKKRMFEKGFPKQSLEICQIQAKSFYMLAQKQDHEIFAIIMKDIEKALESK